VSKASITENKISIVTFDDPMQQRIVDKLAAALSEKRRTMKEIEDHINEGRYPLRTSEQRVHDLSRTAVALNERCGALTECAQIAGVSTDVLGDFWAGKSVTSAGQIDD